MCFGIVVDVFCKATCFVYAFFQLQYVLALT